MAHILQRFNSLAPRRFERNFRKVIFKVIDVWGISCEIVLPWTPQDLTVDKSTLVQVMAWCRQATSHYLSQCWPSSLSPYSITRPQWVNTDGAKQFRVIAKCDTVQSGLGDHWKMVHLRFESPLMLYVWKGTWNCQEPITMFVAHNRTAAHLRLFCTNSSIFTLFRSTLVVESLRLFH